MVVGVNPKRQAEGIRCIQRESAAFNSGSELAIRPFEERLDRLYVKERDFEEMIAYATILAIFVACLGLFGSSYIMFQQRVKEVGIRKILGTSWREIAALISMFPPAAASTQPEERPMFISRRRLLIAGSGLLIPWTYGLSRIRSINPTEPEVVHDSFPSQHPERVRSIVGASHGRVEEVRTLLNETPALANAAIDWGFGDWETALSAASHVGNREIAAMLIDHGARPDIFTFAMLVPLQLSNLV